MTMNRDIRRGYSTGKTFEGTIMRKVLFAIVMMTFSVAASASQHMTMSVGEIKLLRLSPIERVAVGQSAVLSTSLLKNGQLLLLGEARAPRRSTCGSRTARRRNTRSSSPRRTRRRWPTT